MIIDSIAGTLRYDDGTISADSISLSNEGHRFFAAATLDAWVVNVNARMSAREIELMVEFGMTPQQAAEAPNFNSFQLHDSFGEHEIFPGRMELNDAVPDWVRRDLA